ncbi:iron-hydroxamate ABC transporter substrate-binding protein [Paenibacillus sp. FSL H7-0331]|uniref:iron-hydroxamate ABC transporter substrate-binding protein n=1 Tax=Paenibacillus sp. FSL H7-0331 TaxID=1920421 RepID=UPI00096F5CE0|nr:iron-hydroxamate ABC transporter substrate-binding protein [Paenibacillus sp. FSL H7-0331]OMF05029.1 iron-hydroxamate ABC transporter substrate-binding protein [Paenibacillus sp. FSL H7-0331]
MKKTLMILLSAVSMITVSACAQPTPQTAAPQPAPAAAPAAANDKTAAKAPRIASVSIHLTNDLLALGITPVGSVIGGDLKAFLPHVADRLKDTKPLGVVTEPDMEAILSLKPDVIYLDKQYAGKDISKYEKIAPSVVFDLDEGTWRDHLKKIGKLVDRDKEAETFIKDYEAQKERVKGLINTKLGKDATVMAVRVTAKELRVFGTRRPMGPLLYEDLGLKPAKGVEKVSKDKAFDVISQEVLPDYDADAIFVIVNREDGAEKLYKQIESNPIWQGLKAVKSQHVYLIPDQPWLDYSALGTKMALDDAEKKFAK